MLITEYTEATQLHPDNVFLQDGPGGTKKIQAQTLAKSLPLLLTSDNISVIKNGNKIMVLTDDGPKLLEMNQDVYYDILDEFITVEDRKNTFRGKNLGDHVTDEQYARIADGTFKGFFIGDYWLINNIHWRIADIDYWFGVYIPKLTTHHLVIFPDESLTISKMYEDMGSYVNGLFNSIIVNQGNGILRDLRINLYEPIFGNDHILYISQWVTNSIENNIANGVFVTFSSQIPTDIMVCGAPFFAMPKHHQLPSAQIALTKLNPYFIQPSDKRYWLAQPSITDYGMFSEISHIGFVGSIAVTSECGIRPLLALKG